MSYYDFTELGLKRVLAQARRNDEIASSSLFLDLMCGPGPEQDVKYIEGVLKARQEGKIPPYDSSHVVELSGVGRARPRRESRGPRLTRGTRYTVRRVLYRGKDRWEVQLEDVGTIHHAEFLYYNARHFTRVPS